MYDDEFVEEDSYELDSFEMDPSKKQETVTDMAPPKLADQEQKIESKQNTEFGLSSQSSNQTGRFESLRNVDDLVQKKSSELDYERAKTEPKK